jgi:hypothetical protein
MMILSWKVLSRAALLCRSESVSFEKPIRERCHDPIHLHIAKSASDKIVE